MRPITALVLLPVLLLGTAAIRAEPPATAAPLSERYRKIAAFPVPVAEISGWVHVAEGPDGEQTFLAVSDEDRYDADTRTVHDALHLVTLRVNEDEASCVEAPRPIVLHLGDLVPRLDPAWASGGTAFDLEAIARVPGTADLYLLGGESNPEDRTDNGANRLYLLRHPTGSEDRADLLAYVRIEDLPGDLTNDRFEAVVVLPIPDEEDGWAVHAFKERSSALPRPPVYVSGLLRRSAGGFTFRRIRAGNDEGLTERLSEDRARIASQADACRGPDGTVWVLDRWRREIHVVRPGPQPLRLAWEESLDYLALVKDVPEEVMRSEPPAWGSTRWGFGRQEALAFDPRGRLYLAADLGSGKPSYVTVLAPREDGGD
ncbi:MAG: hypothetical protein ACYTG6_15775 [Planctomycetota bacterium]